MCDYLRCSQYAYQNELDSGTTEMLCLLWVPAAAFELVRSSYNAEIGEVRCVHCDLEHDESVIDPNADNVGRDVSVCF